MASIKKRGYTIAGSASTLKASGNTGRKGYGFEIKKDFFKLANDKVLKNFQTNLF